MYRRPRNTQTRKAIRTALTNSATVPDSDGKEKESKSFTDDVKMF